MTTIAPSLLSADFLRFLSGADVYFQSRWGLDVLGLWHPVEVIKENPDLISISGFAWQINVELNLKFPNF